MADPRILIIDDDHDVLLTARMFLEQLEFDVTVLSNPENILSQIAREHYDVILLDMNFQRGKTEGVEGIRWLEAIREHEPDIVGMSSLLTVALETTKQTIDAIAEAGLRDKVRIIVGGGRIDSHATEYIKPDASTDNAAQGVRMCIGLMRGEGV